MSAAQRADLVARHIDWLITVDPKRRVIRDAAVAVKGGRAVVTSALDNLLKGASSQAVQNMNVMFGVEETAGLL